jgi:hypothetical protein
MPRGEEAEGAARGILAVLRAPVYSAGIALIRDLDGVYRAVSRGFLARDLGGLGDLLYEYNSHSIPHLEHLGTIVRAKAAPHT